MMHGTLVVICVLALAAPAFSEIYRWKDQNGVEHFTTHLADVPPSQRDLAKARAAVKSGSLQRVETTARPTPTPTPKRAASSASAPAHGAGEDAIEGRTEPQWREEATRLRARVALYAPHVERCEGDSLRISAGSSREHIREEAAEAEACERNRFEHSLAEKALADFEERAHRTGVPPGWIRE
jgi:hypothetical protein